MAKPIPQKKIIAKKKSKTLNAEARLHELDRIAEERMKWVTLLLNENPNEVLSAIETMVDSLQQMQGPPKLTVDGHIVPLSEPQFKLLQSIQYRNFNWIAMRCLVACAEWDIRIANFTATKHNCLRCGRRVKK